MTDASALRISLIALALMVGCGREVHYEDGIYRNPETSFHVSQPGPGFDRREHVSPTGLAWEGVDGAMVLVNSRCDRSLDIPLEALLRHLVIGFTEQTLVRASRLPMDRREALEHHLLAKIDGVPRELLLRVLKKDGCVYDFALVAAPGGAFESARPGYQRVVESFQTR